MIRARGFSQLPNLRVQRVFYATRNSLDMFFFYVIIVVINFKKEMIMARERVAKKLVATVMVTIATVASALEDYGGKQSYVIDVPSGGTVELTSAMATDILAAEQLVKKGDGLLVNTNNVLSSFAGDIVLEKGMMLVWQEGDLGAVADTRTVVSNGATLKIESPLNKEQTFLKEKFEFAGKGYNGTSGAFYWKMKKEHYNAHISNGVTLNGDTLIALGSRINWGGTLNMNGYSLEKKGSHFFNISFIPVNAGALFKNTGGGVQLAGSAFEGGSAESQFRVENTYANFDLWNLYGTSKWTLSLNEGAGVRVVSGTSESNNRWGGPIVIGKWNVWFGSTVENSHLSLKGNISSSNSNHRDYALNMYGKGGGKKDIKEWTMHLYGTNTYGGRTYIDGVMNLVTHSPKAISTKYGFDINNARSVSLANESSLPQVNWNAKSQDGIIRGWENVNLKGLLKTGEKSLDISFVNIENKLSVSNGVVKLNPSGIYRGETNGFSTVNYGTVSTFENGKFKYIEPTSVVDDLVEAYSNRYFIGSGELGNEPYKSAKFTYSGYMWNHNATNETWSFILRYDDGGTMWVHNAQVLDGNGVQGPVNVVMKPGPNKVDITIGNAWGSGGAHDYFGLGYDPQGRMSTDYNDYRKMNNVSNLWTYLGPDPEKPYTGINELIVWEDGVFDMNQFYCSFNNIKSEGGAITNGNLIVEKRLTFPASLKKLNLVGETSTLEFKDTAEIVFENESALDKSQKYVVASSLNKIKGNNPVVVSENGYWKARKENEDKDLVLYYNGYMYIIIR